ncbi:hypothetical protein [Deinococcus sp. Leaf326]|jgi:hypothetical protein|uniref:hypothetical protein n=1 Tax=Deinococcus sp. Leaf326 TaxID=1736338 RepID=UPI0006FEF77F|nr:hypothetical protein [Deinococcus sp. Leaf326]KQQ99372.1 hypothetical protein ASF71_13380 [Deinococcus sp. Leaf326]
MKAAVSALTLLALGLSACAPTQTGSQSYSPVVHSDTDDATVVAPGQTVYAQYTYPGRALGVSDTRYKELKINFGSSVYSDQVSVVGPEAEAAWLRMSASGLPAGVQVSLVRATIARPVDRTTHSGDYVQISYQNVMRVLLKVTASAQAKRGLEVADLTFSDGTSTGTVPLAVEIR